MTGNADGRVRDKDKGEMWWSEATDESGRACRNDVCGTALGGWLFAGDAGWCSAAPAVECGEALAPVSLGGGAAGEPCCGSKMFREVSGRNMEGTLARQEHRRDIDGKSKEDSRVVDKEGA